MVVKPETFDQLNRQAQPYPSFLLPEDATTALSLFAAGFWGWNDGIHLIRHGLTCDFVDTNGDRLWQMAELMPEGHAFHVEDAWEFCERAALEGREWDVVSVDPFMGNMAEAVWDTFYLWLTVARKMVTVTVKTDTHLNAPAGWETSFFPRNSSVAWMVIRRA